MGIFKEQEFPERKIKNLKVNCPASKGVFELCLYGKT